MWFLRGANKRRNLPMQEVVVEFANYRQQKMNENERTFDSKDDSDKLWVEVIIVTSLNAVASKDFLPANNNNVNFVEIRRGVIHVTWT